MSFGNYQGGHNTHMFESTWSWPSYICCQHGRDDLDLYILLGWVVPNVT